MKYRTFITLCVHIVLGIALSIYFVFFHVDSSVKKLMESDIRIVIDSQDEFDEAIKTDGHIYALGEIRGNINVSNISLDGLQYNGKDKADKVQKIKSKLNGNYVYIEFFSEVLSEKITRERNFYNPEKYDRITTIVRKPYAYLDFYDTFSFYGYEFPISNSLMHFVYDKMKTTLIKGRAKEHIISAKYIHDKQPMWLDFTVSNGQIDMDSMVIHNTNSSFDNNARAATGDKAPLETVFGVVLLLAISFGVTVAIQRKIDRLPNFNIIMQKIFGRKEDR